MRFLRFRFASPLALGSNKLIRRRLGSILNCSLLRNAKLDRRPAKEGKSTVDDRRRDERISGCLKERFTTLSSIFKSLPTDVDWLVCEVIHL